ncbi:MAG: hypothetical protein LBI82_03960 [Dysgonamonadaceae bacterium]|nr:hypothetical protein [Dysgonamonadaceae bacterium]
MSDWQNAGWLRKEKNNKNYNLNIIMKKFEIIEEGRLSKSEMGQVFGGKKRYTCAGERIGWYKVEENCDIDVASFSNCLKIYTSCNQSKMACLGYEGPTGPGGCGGIIGQDIDPLSMVKESQFTVE